MKEEQERRGDYSSKGMKEGREGSAAVKERMAGKKKRGERNSKGKEGRGEHSSKGKRKSRKAEERGPQQ